MGQKNAKSKFILYYHSFQQKILKYLKDWENEKGGTTLEKGYIIHPDWIKAWKGISNYDNIKTDYLDDSISESKIIKNNKQKYQNIENFEKEDKYEFNNICYISTDKFLPITEFYSLEYLENFVNEQAYKLLNIIIYQNNLEVENIKYILKKRMFIIFCETKNIIKIILFKEKENENENDILINLNFIFDNNKYYKNYAHFFEKYYSKDIYNFIIGIINTKKNEYIDEKTKRILFKVVYEEKKCNNNHLKTEKNNNIINNENENENENENKINEVNNNNNNNFNSNLYSINKQSENSLQENNINNFDIIKDLSLNEKKIENNISQLNTAISENVNNISSLSNDGEEINVHFQSGDNKINKTLSFNKNNIFGSVLNQYPDIKNNYNLFLVNGKNININSTFEQNKIKDGDNILIY